MLADSFRVSEFPLTCPSQPFAVWNTQKRQKTTAGEVFFGYPPPPTWISYQAYDNLLKHAIEAVNTRRKFVSRTLKYLAFKSTEKWEDHGGLRNSSAELPVIASERLMHVSMDDDVVK
jgi:hypothetical protein